MSSTNKPTFSERMRAFLAAYEVSGSVVTASEAAKINRSAHYRCLERDKDYQAAFDQAERKFGDTLEGHARRLAQNGVYEPVYQNGFLVGHKLKYSTNLIVHLLKAVKPEKYRERVEHSGNKKEPITVIVRSVLDPKPE